MIKKKSQAWFMDFIISLIIATVTLLIYLNLSTNVQNKSLNKMNELNFDARLITNDLLSAGIPRNWEYSEPPPPPDKNPIIIGLTNGDRILNQSKVDDFFEMNGIPPNLEKYKSTKAKFYSEFDYYVYFLGKRKCNTPEFELTCVEKVYSNLNTIFGTGHPSIMEGLAFPCIDPLFSCKLESYIKTDGVNPKNLVRYERSVIKDNKLLKMVVLAWN